MPLFLFILQLILAVATVKACPKVVADICRCEDLHDGVVLDCSNTNGAEVIQVLRENQAALGLLKGLTLQNASIRKLPPRFLAGLYIKKLDLSYNEIATVDDQAFSGMSPVLQELIINHNNLTRVPVTAIASLPTLLRLDLSNNSITDLGAEDALPSLPKLYDINLGSNKICSVHTSMFQNVKNTIQIINFGHNCLKLAPSSAIRGLKELQSLHLHKNNISSLEALTFLNLPVLNLLNLAGNNISDVNRQAFLNVPNLRYLYLTGNRINRLAVHQFASFEQLEMLDLTKNQLTHLPAECLSNLPQLRQLYIGENQISSIDSGAFTNSSIVILILSENELRELPAGILDGLQNLQQVSFKKNRISTVDQNAFYNAPSVVMIDLSYNQIKDLPPSAFLAQLNLLLIDLSHNNITKTPYAALNRRVGTVMLHENPVVCSEKVHMLQDGVGVFVPTSEDIVCGGKPSTTTTTEKPVQRRKMVPHRLSTGEVITPVGAFQQANQIPGIIVAQQPENELIPAIPVDEEDDQIEKSIVPKVLTRSRGPLGSDIANVNIEDSETEEAVVSSDPQAEPVESLGEPIQPVMDETTAKALKPGDEGFTFPPIRPTTLGARIYTDIADNPNIIHPFPVPFLKRGPTAHRATRIKATTANSDELVSAHTLPPSIVIAPRTIPPAIKPESNDIQDTEQFEKFALKVQSSTVATKESDKSKNVETASLGAPTTVIIICLSTVGVVMIAVFLGLCIARHRQMSRFSSSYSDSSAARTNAYVHAQTNQMNMMYGTAGRTGNKTLRPEDSQPWIYNPGSNYCNYYK